MSNFIIDPYRFPVVRSFNQMFTGGGSFSDAVFTPNNADGIKARGEWTVDKDQWGYTTDISLGKFTVGLRKSSALSGNVTCSMGTISGASYSITETSDDTYDDDDIGASFADFDFLFGNTNDLVDNTFVAVFYTGNNALLMGKNATTSTSSQGTPNDCASTCHITVDNTITPEAIGTGGYYRSMDSAIFTG